MSKKRILIDQIVSILDQELNSIALSAKAAHEAATHEESKAEDSHDTRGLEASYLAGAQMARAEIIRKVIANFRFVEVRDFDRSESIGNGPLVELESNGKRAHYFLVEQGGGLSVEFEGKPVQVINVQAPLGDALLGRRLGETVEIEGPRINREYEVVGIA
jgi:transcription elongation GreA/GreB family factor